MTLCPPDCCSGRQPQPSQQLRGAPQRPLEELKGDHEDTDGISEHIDFFFLCHVGKGTYTPVLLARLKFLDSNLVS